MLRHLHLLALKLFRRLPVRARRWVVRRMAPTFTVGAMAVIQREDGALLMLRNSYRGAWGLPGGLLERGEDPEDTVRRETLEETGLEVEPVGVPLVRVSSDARRVDLVFRCRPLGDPAQARATGCAEVVEVRWTPLTRLPELQPEAADGLAALARRDRELAAAIGWTG